jgi:hypothetical protein
MLSCGIPHIKVKVVVLNNAAGELLQMLDGARSSLTPAHRPTLFEIPLLAAFYGCIAGAVSTLMDVASDEGTPDTAIHIQALASSFARLFGDDTESLHHAWDTASLCPVGLGTPPLSSIRPDLPLQRGYRRLPAHARITLLAFAAQAGHSAVMLNAGVLAQRTGLAVSEVHLALHALFARHWLESRAEIASGVVTASPAMFVPVCAGPWSRRAKRS